MNSKTPNILKFNSESEEADWWASRARREYVKRESAGAQSGGKEAQGSTLVAKMNRKSSVQIAIRLPQADLVQAQKFGYQTLLKMLVHEGLARETRRADLSLWQNWICEEEVQRRRPASQGGEGSVRRHNGYGHRAVGSGSPRPPHVLRAPSNSAGHGA